MTEQTEQSTAVTEGGRPMDGDRVIVGRAPRPGTDFATEKLNAGLDRALDVQRRRTRPQERGINGGSR